MDYIPDPEASEHAASILPFVARDFANSIYAVYDEDFKSFRVLVLQQDHDSTGGWREVVDMLSDSYGCRELLQ